MQDSQGLKQASVLPKQLNDQLVFDMATIGLSYTVL